MDTAPPPRPRRFRVVLPAALALTLAWAGCGAPGERGGPERLSPPDPVPPALVFEVHVLDTVSLPCDVGGAGCARVALTYPEILAGPEPVASRARSWVRARVGEHSQEAPGDGPATPREWVREFLDDYRQFKEESPQAVGGWFLERGVHVVRNDTQVVALVFRESSYLGGAHSNSAVEILNLDARSGELLTLTGLVRPGTEAGLQAVVEARVRAAMELPPGTSLSRGGFFDDVLALPQNALLAEEGILLEYNPYEVAPFAMGAIRVTLPWVDVAHLLRDPHRWMPPGG